MFFFTALFSESRRFGSTSLFTINTSGDWGRRSKSCCKTPLGHLVANTAWQISRGSATPTTGVLNVLRYREKKWWENVIFTKHVLSRLTAPLTWAALPWARPLLLPAATFIYREYYVPLGKLSGLLLANGVRSLHSRMMLILLITLWRYAGCDTGIPA